MTNMLSGPRPPTPMSTPIPPTGTQIGSFYTYLDAQRAVEDLAVDGFPVADVTIVGVDLVQVERVTGRLTWRKVIAGGVVFGAWLGLFVGLILGIFTSSILGPLLVGLAMGIMFGVITCVIPYAATHGKRDFSSTMQLVAGRYDLVCNPASAERARGTLTRALRP